MIIAAPSSLLDEKWYNRGMVGADTAFDKRTLTDYFAGRPYA